MVTSHSFKQWSTSESSRTITVKESGTYTAYYEDGDGIPYDIDNCPDTPNGPNSGTCVSCNDGTIGSSCTANEQCSGGYCSMNQEDYDGDTIGDVCDVAEDTYPPDGNGCIDACECEGNFDNDLDVDGTDTTTFLGDLGRFF